MKVTVQRLQDRISTFRVLVGKDSDILLGWIRLVREPKPHWIARDRGTSTSASAVRSFSDHTSAVLWLSKRENV